MDDGAFAWTLPCPSFEPVCGGENGDNVVRAPDGVHFCPSGRMTQIGSSNRTRRLLVGSAPMRLGHAPRRAGRRRRAMT